ncbi:mitochondrial inner membrane peptidase complex catalytic subunit [Meredithblackwellia eburnea MCA 4105]
MVTSKAGRYAVNTLKVVCAYHLLITRVVEVRPCGGASMLPTLNYQGDYIVHSPLLLRFSRPKRGQLVTAISPLDPSAEVLKRVIGIPGDTVCVDPSGERGRVSGGGNEDGGDKMEYVRIPKGHVWLAGDNTSNSTDSRDYGPVPVGLVKGIVLAKLWPKPSMLDSNFSVRA